MDEIVGRITPSIGFTAYIDPTIMAPVLPALANECIVLLKETSVAGYIAVIDLTKGGDIIRSITYDAYPAMILVAVVYLIMVIGLTSVLSRLERRMRKGDKR